MSRETLQVTIDRLNDTILQLGKTLAALEQNADLRSRGLELRMSALDERLAKTATDTRLAEFRGEVLREHRLLHDKLDLLLQAGR